MSVKSSAFGSLAALIAATALSCGAAYAQQNHPASFLVRS